MSKRFKILAIIVSLVFVGTLAWYIVRGLLVQHFLKNFQFPPASVSTQVVAKQSVTPKIEAIGVLSAVDSVELSATVPGQVTEILFHSGQYVRKGEVLVELDHDTDEQSLESARAQLHVDGLNYKRLTYLRQRGAVAQSDLDMAKASWLRSQAAVKNAEVLLQKKLLKAPFSGRIGISNANVGQYFSPGQPMVNLESVGTYHVDFNLPEQKISSVKIGRVIEVAVDTAEGQAVQKIRAKIAAIAPAVDTTTHTFKVQAVTSEKVGAYFMPGRFVKVFVLQPKIMLLMVPKTAVSYTLYGDSVYIVTHSTDSKGKARLVVKQNFVKLGAEMGNKVAILSGLQVGQEVVTAGQVKLQPEARVIVNNSVSLDK